MWWWQVGPSPFSFKSDTCVRAGVGVVAQGCIFASCVVSSVTQKARSQVNMDSGEGKRG
jgi:hypothetical protein